jgi:hypothetical protein
VVRFDTLGEIASECPDFPRGVRKAPILLLQSMVMYKQRTLDGKLTAVLQGRAKPCPENERVTYATEEKFGPSADYLMTLT